MTDLTYEQLVEKVARAICKTDGFDPDAPGEMKGCKPSPWWIEAGYEMSAIAAISTIREALKEPTEAMNVAGCAADDVLGELVDWRGKNCTTREAVSNVFTAMLAKSPLYDEGK